MNRTHWFTRPMTAAASALLATALLVTALAQPPEPPPGPPEGGPPPQVGDPLRGALDANHDFELDADEIAKASEALAKLDKNGDGKIDREEFRPGLPPGGPGRGPGERGFERPRRAGERGGRPPRDDGPPPRGDRPPPAAGESPDDRPPPPPPPRDGESPDGPPAPREGFRPGAGGPGDRPSPERFLERAKEFDADGDGKLDETELKKMAESMAERMRARVQAGPGGPPRDGGERPERPRRPE